MSLGRIEIILLIALVITLLFVGGKKLPELARGLGESVKEIKKGFKEDDKETDDKTKTKKS
ncbi:twin-arginine translocase TatA/TatE family subunit [Candidatus Saccharibacteria bacterium]|nr:twin-arginine translocase TatA/TatE family subunit [Candidatus Saccharibacteria bacterium]